MAVVAPDSPPSVLVVDDDRDTVTTTVVLLQQCGFQVECAHNGITALALAEAVRFDLILLDLGMPRLDGYAVARAIRQVQEPSPLLVAVSGYGQRDDVIKCAAAGFDLHLLRPANTAMLAELPAASEPFLGQRDQRRGAHVAPLIIRSISEAGIRRRLLI